MGDFEISDAYYSYVDESGDLVHVSARFLQIVRQLRKKQTSAEVILWECLRSRRLGGHKFRRQFPVLGYVVDFYCISKNLAVELDGSVHNDPEIKLRDQGRQKKLENLGVKILRFKNEELFNSIEEVLGTIHTTLDQIYPPSPSIVPSYYLQIV